MLPLALTLSTRNVVLIGNGLATEKRFHTLLKAGAVNLTLYADNPLSELALLAGDRWVGRLPTEADLADAGIIFIADLPVEQAKPYVEFARKNRILVNVEDVNELCDFHVPSIVRRGDLLIAVSTGGGSPALARAIRLFIESLFPPVWADRVAEAARLRREWRKEGASYREVSERTQALLREQGWLDWHKGEGI